jgi:hypothetical protein
MMSDVRTTIRIDDELYRAVKERAARSGRTIAAVLEDAVRVGLNEPPPDRARRRYAVVARGRGGLRPGVDLASNTSVLEARDDGVALDALR